MFLTSSKEISAVLNKSGHLRSYNDVRLLGDHWGKLSSTKTEIFDNLLIDNWYPTCFGLDNNDGFSKMMITNTGN